MSVLQRGTGRGKPSLMCHQPPMKSTVGWASTTVGQRQTACVANLQSPSSDLKLHTHTVRGVGPNVVLCSQGLQPKTLWIVMVHYSMTLVALPIVFGSGCDNRRLSRGYAGCLRWYLGC